jgi:hypothetical protein
VKSEYLLLLFLIGSTCVIVSCCAIRAGEDSELGTLTFLEFCENLERHSSRRVLSHFVLVEHANLYSKDE